MTSAAISWAVRGKPAGSLADYDVIASGGPVFGKRDLTTIFSWFSLGNPPPEPDGPGALPWVAFSVVHKDGRHHVGVAIYRWSADRDGAGRPIVLSSHFFLPYDLLRDHEMSYRAVLAAVRDVEPPADGMELRVELPTNAPEDLVPVIEALGRDRVERAAAMLLDGPVTVTHADALPLEDRLAFLDAVAALLPYGWRTRFTAGTWFDSGGPRIGLAFARRARSGSAELNWTAPASPAPGGAGDAYLRWLRELTARRGRPLGRLVGELAAAGEPLADNEPAEAVRVLEDLDWPTTVLLRARENDAAPEELAALFRGGRYTELRPADTALLFDRLVELGRDDDLPLVERLWHAREGRPKTLIRGARLRLYREEPEPATDRAALAVRLGFGEEFLAGIVRAPRTGAVRAGARTETAVAGIVHAHGAPAEEALLKALAGHGAVLGELFVRIGGDPRGDPTPWLKALGPVAEESLLRPFHQIWRAPVSISMLDGLERHGPLCVPSLVRTAAAIDGLKRVLPALVPWLTGRDTADLTAWGPLLRALEPVDPAEQGSLDALLVWLGESPRHLKDAAAGTPQDYAKAFRAAYRTVRKNGDRDRFAETLARYFAVIAWPENPGLTETVTAIASAFSDHHHLVHVVLAGRAIHGGLLDDRHFACWRDEVHAHHPSLEKEEAMAILTALPARAEPEATGTLCAEALLAGQSPDDVVDCLVRSRWRINDDRAIRLILATRQSLLQRGTTAEDAEHFALHVGAGLIRVLPPEVAQSLRDTASVRGVGEMTFQLNLILTLTRDRDNKKRFHLEDSSRGMLRILASQALRVAGRRSRIRRGR